MFPLRDSTPSENFPIVTVILILVNIVIFYSTTTLGLQGMENLFALFGLVPAYYSQYQVSPIGYLPFLTSIFLHGSWMHVIGNMWILWLFGDNLEDRMGKVRFLIFYLLCGVLAAFTHYFINPASAIPVVGASGAVAGVMGAYFLKFRHAKVLTFIPPFFLFNLPAWIYLGFWALSQLWCGAAGVLASNACGSIAFWAHIGGFLAGMLIYKFFLKAEPDYKY
ncbi:MAG: rhomboid family intramembrane serine protease [Syntrophomonadaceae bacterium]|nr:rhomboid family intramembrane serine protease [Syntrophomonadaceae bacterium]